MRISFVMKKFLGIIFFSFFLFNLIFAEERSEIEVKNGIFLEDVEAFGTFEKINTAPLGMFETKHNQFVKMSKYSQSKIGLIFVNQKRILDKYPEDLISNFDNSLSYFDNVYVDDQGDGTYQINEIGQNIGYRKGKVYFNISEQKLYRLGEDGKTFTEVDMTDFAD